MSRRLSAVFAAAVALALSTLLAFLPAQAAESPVQRLAGADRYEVSALISAKNFTPNVAVAYVATGATFADALSGAPAAGAAGGPVLLVTKDRVPDAILTELKRLKPQRIVILGGANSVSTDVEAELRRLTSGSVERIAGADRYEVSAEISRRSFESGVAVAYLATGATFADALSGAPAAAISRGPVLLVPGTLIPASIAAELDRLNPGRIVILGGPNSVSTSVEASLDPYTDGAVTRISGADRYDVSALISRSTFAEGVPVAYIATGATFADALSGAPVAGITRGPVLLVPGTSIPAPIIAELERLNPGRIVILGGPNSVSTGVEEQLARFVVPPTVPPTPTTCGTISRDETWASKVTLACDVTVAEGATVTLTGSADVIIPAGRGIGVAGSLVTARGSDSAVIRAAGSGRAQLTGSGTLRLDGATVRGLDLELTSCVSLSAVSTTFDRSRLISQRCSDVEVRSSSFGGIAQPLSVWDTDLTGVSFTGSTRNSFAGIGAARVVSLGGTVPEGESYALASDGGAVFTGTIGVSGHVTVAKGSIFKGGHFEVTEGSLSVEGTQADPVHFTSYYDDSIAGDSDGAGAVPIPDAEMRGHSFIEAAALTSPAVVTVDHATFDHGNAVYWHEAEAQQGSRLRISDSITRGQIRVSAQQATVSITRTVFDVPADPDQTVSPALEVSSGRLDGIILDGPDMNTFIGSGRTNVFVAGGSSFVPEGTEWRLSPDSNALFTLETAVSGTLTVEPGTIFKDSRFMVMDGGTVDVNGTAARPVIFTSLLDDTAGGDSDGLPVQPTSNVSTDFPLFEFRGPHSTIDIEHATVDWSVSMVAANVTAPGVSTEGSRLRIADSSSRGRVFLRDFEGEVEIVRNTFDIRPYSWGPRLPLIATPALQLERADITGVALAGTDANRFVGDAQSRLVSFTFSTVQPGTEWTIGSDSGAIFTDALTIAGTLHVNPGTVFKNGTLSVLPGASLDVQGTDDDPVIFTSLEDDAIEGDTNVGHDGGGGPSGSVAIAFHDRDPATENRAEATISGVVFRNLSTAIDVGQWNVVFVSDSLFTGNGKAVEVESASFGDSFDEEYAWAALPCQPPFNSWVTITNSWMGKFALPGIDISATDLIDEFGPSPFPPNMPDDVSMGPLKTAVGDAWDLAYSQVDFTVVDTTNTVPWSMFSCSVGTASITFPWFPVLFTPAGDIPYPIYRAD
ncbi:cell wall-binding repeat-containing protein [Herbiconiux sp. 11R-BC]|uniref:cell wall-binding repeat-containing protein n=1 Tax=Herbiconiux sp. 11R-BC TaxID=3111637 RepID=UPI003C06ECC4